MDRVKKALENHKKGYNCAQAVVCAYADMFGKNEDELFALAEGFGAGMGGMQCTCGAVSGAVMVCGMLLSSGDTLNPTTKGRTYKLSKTVSEAFKLKNGSVICRELKGIDTGEPMRSCAGCIEDAARIIEQLLNTPA